MDEADRKDDIYGLPHIGGELNEQMRQAIDRAETPVEEAWTPEEEAELQAEMSRIQFEDSLYPKDFNPIIADIDGEEVKMPDANNFPMKLMIIDDFNGGNNPPPDGSYEMVLYKVAPDRKYYEIAAKLQQSSPTLYKRTVQLRKAARTNANPSGTKPSDDRVRYIYAKAYTAAAKIALGLDSEYKLAFLFQ